MNQFLNDTLELEKYLGNDLTLSKNQIAQKVLMTPTKRNINAIPFFTKKSKEETNFTSLERIRIVVDSYLEDISVEEICEKENVSRREFFKWRNEFVEAFKKHSEELLIQEKISLTTKELILNETTEEVYNFLVSFIDAHSGKNLVIPKGESLSTYSNFNAIENVIILDKINNFRQINKHLEGVNLKLSNGGVLAGCFETFNSRAQKKQIYKVPVIKEIYFGFEFVFKRVIPKLPFLKKVYFSLTKGNDRLLSKAEALGRLVSCGFDILDFKEIDGIHYFAAMKVKEPAYDMNPSYGPLFKMQRVGKNGKIIGVYKFRTMHPYSEYLQDYVLKLNGYADTGKPADDFRLVPWGRFLRKFWLDELPQLINVFKGELKLVGSRPVSKRYFQDIPKDIQELRLKQKPGCIPPYVALNRKSSVDSVLQSEKEYLEEKLRNPYFTDTKYFFKAIYNIVFKGKRSA